MRFKVKDFYQLTEEVRVELMNGEIKDYPLYTDDVFTKNEDGTYTKHTGLCITNLILPEDKLIFREDEVTLEII